MADDKTKTATNRKRIDVNSAKFGVTKEQLKAAVQKVRTNAEDVTREVAGTPRINQE